jgi:hypothetical protein
MRKPKNLGWAGALLLGLALAAGYAAADTSADKEPAKAGKAKPGDPCKVNADCDQSGRPQFCRASKCEFAPTHKVT